MSVQIPVALPQNAYEIAIANGGLAAAGTWLQQAGLKAGTKLLVVTNPAIGRRYGDRLLASLQEAGFEVGYLTLPAGERYKTPATVQRIYDKALELRLERRSALVALGGGVIGDMTGFAAATWLRGIRFVQIPTSLLAMVDASIGGKTGVNHPHGKNLIGAFHQPKLVLIDPETLQTLPVREFRAGMAEVIKYGVIWDRDLFERLEASPRLDRPRSLPADLLTLILERSCRAKAEVVAKDEKESGLRAILNYGHTIGHAVESLTGYRVVNHGEAVAIGMVAAGRLAVALGLWNQDECDRQEAVITKAGLPTRLPEGLDQAAIVEALQFDKKVQAGKVRFILPTTLGHVTITDQVPSQTLREVLRAIATP